ncbi:MAG: O-antigen ligase family protein [Bryobacteraceae bacterium]|nr:O-antigen ligase family protein [Bryobacteraceae bacterium]
MNARGSSGVIVPPLAAPPQALPLPSTDNTGQSLALRIFLVYLFILFARPTDFVLTGLRLPAIFFLLTIVLTLLVGGVQRAINHRVALFFGAFLFWMTIAVPTSVYRGGSVATLINTLYAAAIFVAVGGLATSIRHLRSILITLGFCTVFFAVFTALTGETINERLMGEQGTFSNANDLAQLLLMGLPFLVFVFFEWKDKPFARFLVALSMLPVAWSLARTGSRAMLLTSAVLFVVLFFRAPFAWKAKLLALGAIALVGTALVLPGKLKERYVTLEQGSEEVGDAVGSTVNRRQLFKQSLILTAEHPIFGVGPGMFPVATSEEKKDDRPEWSAWRVTHNLYTQVSSECGIPALIFYVLALVGAFRAIGRAERLHARSPHPVSQSIVRSAVTIRLAFLSFCVFGMFLSIAYNYQVFTLTGLAVALERVAVRHAHEIQAASAAPGR